MSRVLWWVRQSLLVLISCFFLYFGVSLFRAAYKMNDPFLFIMTVFASNLMILISATLLIGFVYRMINVYKLIKKQAEE